MVPKCNKLLWRYDNFFKLDRGKKIFTRLKVGYNVPGTIVIHSSRETTTGIAAGTGITTLG